MRKNKRWAYLFLAPGVLLFIFVFLISIGVLATTSFCDWTIGSDLTFVGLKNYVHLFTQDKDFITSIFNTLIWIVLQATFHIAIGTALALILSKKKWYTNLVRTTFMIPNIISSAALGMLFLCVFNPQFGMINGLIEGITGNEFGHNWFMNPSTSFLTVTMTWLPYAATVTILVMAEMASIPVEIFEAAKVDGASSIQIDFKVILPMMRNIIGTTTILAASSMLQKLDVIMMTTGGGPGVRTMNMPMYLYQTALTDNNYGLANAQGVVLILLGLGVVVLIRKIYRMDSDK